MTIKYTVIPFLLCTMLVSGCSFGEKVAGDDSFLARPGTQFVKNTTLRIAAQEVVRRGLLNDTVDPVKAEKAIDAVAAHILMSPPDWDGAYAVVSSSISPQYQLVARDIITMARMLANENLSAGQLMRFREGVISIVAGAKSGLTFANAKES